MIDEADRCLDIGFLPTIETIFSFLPSGDGDDDSRRQTLLYSATQKKSFGALVSLSLHDPCYVGVHDSSASATPERLTQHYTLLELPMKFNVVFSFVKAHIKSKMIVFVSSCKQVRTLYACCYHRHRLGLCSKCSVN